MTEKAESESPAVKRDEPVRQQLVDTAINFLLNPDIIPKSYDSKMAFLKKKGLTDTEISLAFQMSQRSAPPVPPTLDSSYVLPPHLNTMRTYSMWSRFRNIGSSIIILGVAIYGMHQFYQLYIEPWIFGKGSRLSTVEKQLLEMNSSMAQLKSSVSVLEDTINSQKVQIDNYLLTELSGCKPIPLVLSELKIEVEKLKSLLTNRHQFPSLPKASSPSIPLWQLQSAKSDEESGNDASKKAESEINQLVNGEANENTGDDKSLEDGVTLQQSSKLQEMAGEILKEPTINPLTQTSNSRATAKIESDISQSAENQINGSVCTVDES